MTNVEFEQMLSFHPKLETLKRPISEVCLRDMIYQYYLTYFDEGTADDFTTLYIAKLWEKVETK